jgi:hypothetical protein
MSYDSKEATVPLEDLKSCVSKKTPPRSADKYQIEVIDQDFNVHSVFIDDPIPTGRQILEAANHSPVNEYMLLMFQETGMLEEVNLSEKVDIYQQGVEKFIAFLSDRIFYFELDGRRYPWGSKFINEAELRAVGRISEGYELWMEYRKEKDKRLGQGDKVDLSENGLEKIYSESRSWELNVHGVRIKSDKPTILASEAMEMAGFNPAEGWILILKVKGEPKQSITINDAIDLTTPGIEKLRLTPAEVNNGETATVLSTVFPLLEKDALYLNNLGQQWETIIDGRRRWLILRNYALPCGYNHVKTDIAIDIPAAYPDAAIDMFYCFPPLRLTSSVVIPQTSVNVLIEGRNYQQWSRHLNGITRWNPLTDSVITQMAVIEESLLREVGE